MIDGSPCPERPPLSIAVPASTSNLGPGYDLIGLALSLWLRVEVRERGGGVLDHRLVLGEGAAAWPDGPSNLLLQAFERAQRELGGTARGLSFAVESEIPVGRGLGSSGAAIAAGLLLGAALAPGVVTRGSLLEWALELEGHPDNVAPALFGGCQLALPRVDGPTALLSQELHPSLAFAVAWPERPFPTAEARALLPGEVPHGDAVENARRLAFLLEGLRTGDPATLTLGGVDRLHVPYRLEHLPGAARAVEAAVGAGAHFATLSGSGSAVLAVTAEERAGGVAEAMAEAFRRADGTGTGRVVRPVLEAPQPGLHSPST